MSEGDVETGTRAMLARRAEVLGEGAQAIGWKVGFNVPAVQEKLGISAPLAGFLTNAGALADGAEFATGGARFVAEPEVAVELGADARTIAALLPALEVADPPDLSWDVGSILAGNIFHRAVAFGPRTEGVTPGEARVLLNGEETERVPAERTSAHLEAMVEAVGRRLDAAGEELRPGDRIITGVLAPPPGVGDGDRVRLEIDGLGAVELGFSSSRRRAGCATRQARPPRCAPAGSRAPTRSRPAATQPIRGCPSPRATGRVTGPPRSGPRRGRSPAPDR